MTVYDQDFPALSQLTLGKKTAYADQYDATLLQAVPRSLNRIPLGLSTDALPFKGVDIWTLYELSWLNPKGLPQVAIGEVCVAADSQHLIESKSFKLYLNSFNQTHFDSWHQVEETLQRDLARCAEGGVTVALFDLSTVAGQPIGQFQGACIDDQDIEINNYLFDATLLQHAVSNPDDRVRETLVSHLLKSNCLITNQPDWGSVQISYEGARINQEALLRYLVSFRHHNEFHEQCVERIFNDIQRYCAPTQLTVYARYTRRGGLDINPYRTNTQELPETSRLARQ